MQTHFLTAAALLAALSTTGAGIVHADSATGTQTPSLTVTVSLSPDTVMAGDTVTETKSVTNNTKHPLDILLVKELKTPEGKVFRETLKDRIGADKTQSSTHTFKVGDKAKEGEYTLLFSARDKKGRSVAKATTTVGE